jgi:hypothetical protein
MVADGQSATESCIEEVFPLDDFAEAHRCVEAAKNFSWPLLRID